MSTKVKRFLRLGFSSRPNCMRTGSDEIMNANYNLDDQLTLTDLHVM